MGSSKAPDPPNYVGAAQAQGAANLEAAKLTGMMNNPNIVNPYGSQKVTWAGGTPTIVQTLAPAQQKLLDTANVAKQSLADTGVNLSNNIKGTLSNPVDFSGLAKAPGEPGKIRDDVVKAIMSRVDISNQAQKNQANSDMIAAGIPVTSDAYQATMRGINNQYNDAQQQAIISGGQQAAQDYGQTMQSHQQAIADYLSQRDTPLNEINALQTGSQVSNPFSGNLGYQGGMNVNAAPVAGAIAQQGQAAQNQYNMNQAQTNGNIQAGAGLIGSLGSAALSR